MPLNKETKPLKDKLFWDLIIRMYGVIRFFFIGEVDEGFNII